MKNKIQRKHISIKTAPDDTEKDEIRRDAMVYARDTLEIEELIDRRNYAAIEVVKFVSLYGASEHVIEYDEEFSKQPEVVIAPVITTNVSAYLQNSKSKSNLTVKFSGKLKNSDQKLMYRISGETPDVVESDSVVVNIVPSVSFDSEYVSFHRGANVINPVPTISNFSTSTNYGVGGPEYLWEIVSSPLGSGVSFSDSSSIRPVFSTDSLGDHTIRLTVDDINTGKTVSADTTLSVVNRAPTIELGDTLLKSNSLLGSNINISSGDYSVSDPDSDPLSISWTLLSSPVGSTPNFVSTGGSTGARITPDLPGIYSVQAVVDDGTGTANSTTADVVNIFVNSLPVINATQNKTKISKTNTALSKNFLLIDARLSTSSDDSQTLTYSWDITSKPAGAPDLVIDNYYGTDKWKKIITNGFPGNYELTLTVDDGIDTVSEIFDFTVNTPPVASVALPGGLYYRSSGDSYINDFILLDALSASSDINAEDVLSYTWLLVDPDGVVLTYLDNDIDSSFYGAKSLYVETVKLKPHKLGTYLIELTIDDGLDQDVYSSSIVVNNRQPIASILDDDIYLSTGINAVIDATLSYDPDGGALNYTWSYNNYLGFTLGISTIDNPIQGGDDSSILKVNHAVPDESHSYSLEITDSDGGESGPIFATIHTKENPSINSSFSYRKAEKADSFSGGYNSYSDSVSITANEKIELTPLVTYSGDDIDLSYLWEIKHSTSSNWNSIGTNKILEYEPSALITSTVERWLRLTVFNNLYLGGSDIVTLPSIDITVPAAPVITNISKLPINDRYGGPYNIYAGLSFTLVPTVSNAASSNLTYEWFKEVPTFHGSGTTFESLETGSGTTGSDMSLTVSTSITDEGEVYLYKLYITDSFSQNDSDQISITVDVNRDPTITSVKWRGWYVNNYNIIENNTTLTSLDTSSPYDTTYYNDSGFIRVKEGKEIKLFTYGVDPEGLSITRRWEKNSGSGWNAISMATDYFYAFTPTSGDSSSIGRNNYIRSVLVDDEGNETVANLFKLLCLSNAPPNIIESSSAESTTELVPVFISATITEPESEVFSIVWSKSNSTVSLASGDTVLGASTTIETQTGLTNGVHSVSYVPEIGEEGIMYVQGTVTDSSGNSSQTNICSVSVSEAPSLAGDITVNSSYVKTKMTPGEFLTLSSTLINTNSLEITYKWYKLRSDGITTDRSTISGVENSSSITDSTSNGNLSGYDFLRYKVELCNSSGDIVFDTAYTDNMDILRDSAAISDGVQMWKLNYISYSTRLGWENNSNDSYVDYTSIINIGATSYVGEDFDGIRFKCFPDIAEGMVSAYTSSGVPLEISSYQWVEYDPVSILSDPASLRWSNIDVSRSFSTTPHTNQQFLSYDPRLTVPEVLELGGDYLLKWIRCKFTDSLGNIRLGPIYKLRIYSGTSGNAP